VTHSNCTDGDMRLAGGSVSYEGRVEVCINRAWGTVCYEKSRYYYNYWGISDATVVCRQLGYQERGKSEDSYMYGVWAFSAYKPIIILYS
jgi:hypothetical protein